jgi:hypothetical protein
MELVGDSSVTYAIMVEPSTAILGRPITLTLSLTASADATDVLTFEHKSLTIELQRVGSTMEPTWALPNRWVIEEDGLLIRGGTPGGLEDLATGDTRTAEYRLDELYPLAVLEPNDFMVGISLATYDRVERVEPVALHIVSGPAAVDVLFGVLRTDDAARRAVATQLLQRMTAHGEDFDPFAPADVSEDALARWQRWWNESGRALPWNFESDEATTGIVPAPAPATGASGKLGGVALGEPT